MSRQATKEASMNAKKNAGWRFVLIMLAAAAAMLGGWSGAQAQTKERVVLMVSDDNPKNWTTAFNVVNNLTAAYGKGNVEIELVAYSDGINSLTFDSKVASRIPGALERGAKIIACQNSMSRFKLSQGDMAPDISYVPTGVKHSIERQRQGWIAIRP
jgi:hypothetical protein